MIRSPDAAVEEPEVGEEAVGGFDEEENISLTAMEQKLRPQVMDTFANIAITYAKMFRLNANRHTLLQQKKPVPPTHEKKVQSTKAELVDLVRTVRLNTNRTEQLVDQLYGLNRRLVNLEGRLLRMAQTCKITREDFLVRYMGHELDRNWLSEMFEAPKAAKESGKPAKRSARRISRHGPASSNDTDRRSTACAPRSP